MDQDYSKLGIYAIENPLFRNKIMWFYIVLNRLEQALRKYQSEAKIVIENIKEHLNSEK
jgi:hypothetical protein